MAIRRQYGLADKLQLEGYLVDLHITIATEKIT